MEELFCVCIQLLNKTWKEMRATQEDFDKVKYHVSQQWTGNKLTTRQQQDVFLLSAIWKRGEALEVRVISVVINK